MISPDELERDFQQRAEQDAFSGVVLITQGSSQLFAGAYGYASRSWKVPNTLATRFDTASVTKLFTAVATLQLIDRGLLAFDTPVIDFLGLQDTAITRAVNIFHLLTHTSGISVEKGQDLTSFIPKFTIIRARHGYFSSGRASAIRERKVIMALDLYMVGLVPQDMDKSLEFYRRLGVDLSELREGQPHFKSQMKGDITFFLNNMGLVEEADKPRLILEFYLKERAAVDAKYNELTGFGYQSYRAPFVSSFGVYFAMINDPDGNIVLLSAD